MPRRIVGVVHCRWDEMNRSIKQQASRFSGLHRCVPLLMRLRIFFAPVPSQLRFIAIADLRCAQNTAASAPLLCLLLNLLLRPPLPLPLMLSPSPLLPRPTPRSCPWGECFCSVALMFPRLSSPLSPQLQSSPRKLIS